MLLGGKQVWMQDHTTCHAACCHEQRACRNRHLHLLHGVGGHDTEDDWDARIQASAEDAACGRAYYGVKVRRGAPHLQAEAQTVLTAGLGQIFCMYTCSAPAGVVSLPVPDVPVQDGQH